MSKKVKHTPGPWFRQPALNGSRIMGGNKRMVACAFQSEADANLIAAAPELLHHLKLLYTRMTTMHPHIIFSDLEAVIAKAEGK